MKNSKFSILTCLFGSLLSLQVLSADNYNYDNSYDYGGAESEMTPYPFNAYVSHVEGSGIGYNQGYTSAGLLFTPTWKCQGNMQYFLDVRGHVFNNGKPAANVGIGARYLDHCSERIYGANIFYDYRQVHHDGFQQIGIGLEYLGNCWDFRINGYIPFGRNKVDYGRTLFVYPGNYFAECKQREKVMAGFDAEFGMPVWEKCNPCDIFSAYAAIGTYYFTPRIYSKCGRDCWGGKVRVAARIWDYVEIEARTTFDREFHWRGEGVITLSYPFGGRCCEPTCYCDNLRALAVQPVQRQEIIVVNRPCCVWETNFGGFRSLSDSSDSSSSSGSPIAGSSSH
jgi:hypothetical protein